MAAAIGSQKGFGFRYNLMSIPAVAPLAQLDRASGYEPEGREFESLRARHSFRTSPKFQIQTTAEAPE